MKIKLVNLKWLNLKGNGPKIVVATIALVSMLFGLFFKISFGEYDTEAASAPEMLIILDAGHGGEDAGATGINGALEKDLNLSVVNILGEMLTEKGFAVVYTRSEDKLLYEEWENIKGIRKISDLKNRCKIAKSYPNALFVSIHMNTFGDGKYSGLQVYYSPENKESEMLAGAIQSSVKKELQPNNNRNIKQGDDIYILENIDNTAVLIECGFLSNMEEEAKLRDKSYQQKLICVIGSTVCNFLDR